MTIFPGQPTTKVGADRFTGDAAVDQAVHVMAGISRIQARGGEILATRGGDTIQTPRGDWHWHGAAPDRFM